MTIEIIPVADLATVTPSSLDFVIGVQLGNARKFSIDDLWLGSAASAAAAEAAAAAAAASQAAAAASASSAAALGYTTRALLYADLAHAAGEVRWVTNDPTIAYNGAYIKLGASGAGSWQMSADRTTALETRTLTLELWSKSLKHTLNGYGYNKRGEVVWTPLAVALNGEVAPWYDLTDITTLYSDTAGTTQAVVGGTVLLILDKSGGGFHLSQSNAAKAATLQIDVQGNYFLRFPAGTPTYYDCATGGQWTQFSVFAAVRPSQIASVRALFSARSSANAGSNFATQNTARLGIGSGATFLTAVPEFPRPLLVAGGFMAVGGIYDGTNGVAYDADFRSAPTALTHSVNATAGFRVGHDKYFTPASTWEGDLYSLFMVNRAMTVAEARSAANSLGQIVQSGPKINSLSYTRGVVEAAAANVNILLIGDSTGDAKDEWVYRVALRLAQRYPRHTVTYRVFGFSGNAYGTTETVQIGASGFAINIWNVSISLSIPDQTMGDRYANAIAAVTSPNLVVWSHGHNISDTFTAPMIRGQFVGPMEQVRQTWPSARVVAMLQNPHLFDTANDSKYTALRAIQALRTDLQLIDAATVWNNGGYVNAGYYADAGTTGIHPNGDGSKITANVFMDEWDKASLTTLAASTPWLNVTATNLLTNGNFAAFASAVPDNWASTSGTPTPTKDAVVVDGAHAYSFKIANGSAAAASYGQSLSGAQVNTLKGLTVSLAARVRGVSGSTSSATAKVLVTNPAGTTIYQNEQNIGGTEVYGAFMWSAITAIPIPSDATAIEVRLYGSNGTTNGHSGYFDRIVLVQGDIPRDMP